MRTAPSEANAVDQTMETITVQADANSVVLDGQPVELPGLSEAPKGKLVGRTKPEDKVVVLLTADDITFQRNVELMHAIRTAGACQRFATLCCTASGRTGCHLGHLRGLDYPVALQFENYR